MTINPDFLNKEPVSVAIFQSKIHLIIALKRIKNSEISNKKSWNKLEQVLIEEENQKGNKCENVFSLNYLSGKRKLKLL